MRCFFVCKLRLIFFDIRYPAEDFTDYILVFAFSVELKEDKKLIADYDFKGEEVVEYKMNEWVRGLALYPQGSTLPPFPCFSLRFVRFWSLTVLFLGATSKGCSVGTGNQNEFRS